MRSWNDSLLIEVKLWRLPDVILLKARWYCCYALSDRDLEEVMVQRCVYPRWNTVQSSLGRDSAGSAWLSRPKTPRCRSLRNRCSVVLILQHSFNSENSSLLS